VVELCWLTLRCSDARLANLAACALFDDGVAAAILSAEGQIPRIVATGETRFPGTLEVMDWLLADHGLRMLFWPSVPDIARGRLGSALSRFLARHGLDASMPRRSIVGSVIREAQRSWRRPSGLAGTAGLEHS